MISSKKKTMWERMFPGQVHKSAQKNDKINYANKYMLRIILFYLIENAIMVKIRDYQFVRNISEISKIGEAPSFEVVQWLRDMMITENLIIVIITTVISIALLYYCNNKMLKDSQ